MEKKKTPERYYWFYMRDDFFMEPIIKKMRKMPDGEACIINYIRLMQSTVETNGVFEFEAIEDCIEHELALKFDESHEIIKRLLSVLQEHNLLIQMNASTYLFANPEAFIMSESRSSQRVKRYRERKKVHQSCVDETQCNASVTQCNADVTSCNASVTECNAYVTQCNVDVTQDSKSALYGTHIVDDVLEKAIAKKTINISSQQASKKVSAPTSNPYLAVNIPSGNALVSEPIQVMFKKV